MFKRIKKIIAYTTLSLLCLEAALWILGFRPYTNVNYTVASHPENAFLGDSIYGLRLNPGTYNITLNEHIHFETTHLANGKRKIPSSKPDSFLPQIHLLGCSFTYGYGVNDDETFAALLQHSLPNYNVINHSVIGYGTVQSVLQAEREDFIHPNDLVLLGFSSHHFLRNTLSQYYRASLSIGFQNSAKNLEDRMQNARFPFLTNCDEAIGYKPWNKLYTNFIGREYSAGINFIQTLRDRYLDYGIDPVEITECLIQRLLVTCSSRQANLGVICLDTDDRTKQLEKMVPSIPWKNIYFDFTDIHQTNLPYDSHPNALGHSFIHSKILPFVEELAAQ